MSRISDYLLSVQDGEDASEALEYLTAREQQAKRIRATCWSPPPLTPEQQAAQDAYIEEHKLPF